MPAPRKSRITIVEIARHLQLSPATVSYALRGSSEVSDATRQRVQDAAHALGYRSHSAAAILAHQRHHPGKQSGRIGVVILGGESEAALSALATDSRRLGLDVLACDLSEFESPAHALDSLWHRGIEGLHLLTHSLTRYPWSEAEWASADWSRFCVLKHGRIWPSLRFHLFRHNAFDYMMETVARTFEAGYRRVGVITAPTSSPEDDWARIGAVHAYRSERMPANGAIELIKEAPPDRALTLTSKVRRFLAQFRPDALIGFPSGWFRALQHAGYAIPRDTAFASVYVLPSSPQTPGLAGCDVAGGESEARAANRLYSLLRLEERGMVERPLQDLIEPQWHPDVSMPKRAG